MSTTVRNVPDIDAADRQAIEHVLGQALRDDQRVILNVVTNDAIESSGETKPVAARTDSRPPQTIDEWTKIYAGLTEDQIAEIDRIVTTRACLTRDLP